MERNYRPVLTELQLLKLELNLKDMKAIYRRDEIICYIALAVFWAGVIWAHVEDGWENVPVWVVAPALIVTYLFVLKSKKSEKKYKGLKEEYDREAKRFERQQYFKGHEYLGGNE